MNINDEQTLVGAYTNKFGERHALKTYDGGFGTLWVYGETSRLMGVIRARTWEEAYEIARDEVMTRVDEADLVEAYGMYIMEDGERHYVCPDFDTDVAHFQDFECRIPKRRVLADFATEAEARAFALEFAEKAELTIAEGYEYQPNATGTGIVTYDLNGQDLRPLYDGDGIVIQVTED